MKQIIQTMPKNVIKKSVKLITHKSYLVNLLIKNIDNKDITPPAPNKILPITLFSKFKTNDKPIQTALIAIVSKKHIIVNLKLDDFECDFSNEPIFFTPYN